MHTTVKNDLATARRQHQRLAVTIAPSRQLTVDRVVFIAQRAEELGYESIWVPETWGADAVTLLAILARETSTIQLASGVFNIYSRSAGLIAQTAATLQDVSGGRFVLGLGTSGPVVVENWHGMDFKRPLQRSREYVAAIRLALGGARVDIDGKQIRLRGFTLLNAPAQRIPIYVAALGPKNVRLTAEIADGWLPIFAARGHMARLLNDFHEAVREAGRDPFAVDIAAYVPCLIGERGDQLLRGQLAHYVGGMGTYYAAFVTAMGFGDEANAVRTAWATGDRRTAASRISDELLAACSAGSNGAEAVMRFDQYRDEGVRLPVVAFPHGSTEDEMLATLQAVAPNRLSTT